MSTSQNCAFSARPEKDAEFEHPAGAMLARLVGRELKAAGWATSAIENWRDCGWSVDCEREEKKLEVVVAALPDDGRWMLQIAPRSVAGFVGRLFGRTSSATQTDVLALAKEVDRVLKKSGQTGYTLWCRDGFPKSGIATNQPE